MINKEEYLARRRKLFSLMKEGSVLVSFGGVAKVSSADEFFRFEVNRNFYYLCGIDQEDCVLLLIKTDGEEREYLFVPPFDERKEKWYGKRLSLNQAKEISNVNNVLTINAFQGKLDSALNHSIQEFGLIENAYFDFDKEIKVADSSYVSDFIKTIQTAYPYISIIDLLPILTKMRLIKSEGEIAELRKAIEATAIGVKAVMAKVAPGVKEYELSDEFHRVINDENHYQGVSFPTIMASGIHCACLHYPTPLDTLDKGFLLMDLGARNSHYCADVSRTVPVAGIFSEEEKKIYEIVLGCNKMVAHLARPGLTIKELQEATVEYLASECLAAGIISKKEDITDIYFHNVSHFIGLDTHDPYVDPNGLSYKDVPLEAGMVISDEPGLYLAERALGVRIEDDLLITERGCEVLTSSIIKETSDIVRFFKKSN